ncbi:MAG: glutamate--tRNA ligase [Candidatus Buchananbacteria bacterium]
MKVRVRFSPSPTGYLHVGGLRTALYDYLVAKHYHGTFVLRIEDTDRKRFVPGSVETLIKALKWAGLKYQEGPMLVGKKLVSKGKFGPYVQSQRLPLYQKYAQELLKTDQAYYCFCDEQRLEKLRREQALRKEPTRYDGTCRNLTKTEVEKLLKNKVPYVVRFKTPITGETKFTDLIRGEVVWRNELLDDQVILKSDGFPTYHLANVVDDHLMQITHVIRGEEWIPSTPKHLLTYQAFGWTPPAYAHLPLVLNPDKSKLSKRQGDVAVEDYERNGYLPAALLNFVALLGWNPGGDLEVMSLVEMAKLFSWEQINKAGAVFDTQKLDWLNSHYLRELTVKEFAKKLKPYLVAGGVSQVPAKQLLATAKILQSRLKKLSEIKEFVYLFQPINYPVDLLDWKQTTRTKLKANLELLVKHLKQSKATDWSATKLELKIKELIVSQQLNTGEVLWPMRVALSGQKNSPTPFELAEILGLAETLKRLKLAQEKLG